MLYRLRLPALLTILLIAWGVRLWGIASLHLFGDGSYSVYYAAKDLATITHDRIYDGHPPLHYYILHFMRLVAGYNEVAMRLPSLAADLLTCCLLYRFGVDFWRSRFIGMGAALLWAISPFALFYGRMPRMYALMALLCVLSLYLLCRALQKSSWKSWLAYGAATLAALFTQYFSAWIVPVAILYVLTSQKPKVESRKSGLQEQKSAILYSIAGPTFFDLRRLAENTALRALMITLAAVGLLYLPWVLFAFVSSATTTAGIISNAPPPVGLVGYLEQVLIPQAAGVIVPVEIGRFMLLSMIPALLGVVLAWSDLRDRVQERKAMLLAILWWIVPVIIVFLIFLKFPYLARQRFFLYIAPAALLLIVAGVRAIARRNLLLGIAALVLVMANFCYGSFTVLQAEPRMMEPDAVQITQQLEQQARPGDAVILHAFWQGGYLNAHYQGPPLTVFALNDIPPDQWQQILSRYPRVWLAMYEVGERDPKYPLEQILDQNMAKLEAESFGPTRLSLYAVPPSGAATGRPMKITDQSGQPFFELSAPEVGPDSIHAGEALTASWVWQAIHTTPVRYTVYLQLRDASGRTYAGRDSEPESGVVPTMNWQPGESHPDRRGLLVPLQTPAGTYTLWMGLYETGSGTKSARVQVESDQNLHAEVPIGTVTVLPPDGLSPVHPLQADFGGIYTLSGYTLPELDYPAIITTTSYIALLDNPISQTEFKQSYAPGDRLNLTLFWSAAHPQEQKHSVFVHLSDPSGRVVAQADLPLSLQSGRVPIFYTLNLPANLHAGAYTLIAGVYDPANGTRLELPPDIRGRRANAITLQQLLITEPRK